MSYGKRKDFYHSKAWKQVRLNVWLKQNMLCNRCHLPVYVDGLSEYLPKEKRRTGIVHHKIYLDNNNVYDDSITLDESNLEGLCKSCHELEHHQDEVKRLGYDFDELGNLVKKNPHSPPSQLKG